MFISTLSLAYEGVRIVEQVLQLFNILFLDSSTLFDQLGAKDIFKRFNNFLESWKCWQDDERQCKEMLGFDLDMELVESLCVFPSGDDNSCVVLNTLSCILQVIFEYWATR